MRSELPELAAEWQTNTSAQVLQEARPLEAVRKVHLEANEHLQCVTSLN